MDLSQTYISMAIVALLVIVLLLFFFSGNLKEKKMSKLASLAFFFIIAGIVFGEDKLVGYGLIGVGLVLALIDMIQKYKNK